MSTDLTVNYSGIVINQDQTAESYPWNSTGGWIYQTFTLPSNYVRGTDPSEENIPDLSGFQIFASLDAGSAATAALQFVLQFHNPGTGAWQTLTSGTVTGAHTDGEYVWFDALFKHSVPVTPAMLTGSLRIGIQAASTPGIKALWYLPLVPQQSNVSGQAFQSDGVTPLVGLAAALGFRILALSADSGINFLGNEYRSAVVQCGAGNVSTTQGLNPVTGSGNAPFFLSQPQPSRFAVVNLYFNVAQSGQPVVIDSILVDPITPNMAFNVYYSDDTTGDATYMNEDAWDGKLWSRVPQAYTCTQRQQYVFPSPVLAKYIKVEFTNLQSRSYAPGPFQLPVTYKKFPTWVANYFISLLENVSFIPSTVNVEYDALNFAYNYYLDDLRQSPQLPAIPPQNLSSQLQSYFSATPTGVDSTTLSQINLVMHRFANTPTQNVDPSTALGALVTNINNTVSIPQTAEVNTVPNNQYVTVSSLNRESVVFEQSLPVMYFFLTCRHGYKELTSTFDYNRAYFAGVNEVAFMRSDYTVADDTPFYIESGGDQTNMASQGFVVTGNVWTTY